MVGLWVVSFVDLGLWIVIPMSGFSSWRSGFVDLWQIGGFVGCDSDEWVYGFVAKWQDLEDGGDQWVCGFKFLGMQILNGA